jgi:UDP-N-acetylmuramoyl-tripeptide--D-alanyl-D-alanine ligase
MIRLTLEEIVSAIHGKAEGASLTTGVSAVSTDSRSVGAGELFFAIPGDRFDGHDFVTQAFERGAAGAVVAAERFAEVRTAIEHAPARGAGTPLVLIQVDSTVAALGRLAAYHRKQLAAEVIAIAGSNGKTTVKSMVDHILSARFRGRASPRSYNNHIGVPLTLLSADMSDEYLVVEIGTNHPGEVRWLASIARPDIAVITSIGEEHLEGFGDLSGVAREECSIVEELRPGGVAIVNADHSEIRKLLPSGDFTVLRFGESSDAEVLLNNVAYEHPWLIVRINRKFDFRIAVPGRHNAWNVAAAVTVGRRLGFTHEEIAARLETYRPPPMRNEVFEQDGVTFINDAYNANPTSMLAAIHTLESMPATGRRIAVIGGMRELGTRSRELHQNVLRRLTQSMIDVVLIVGGEYGEPASSAAAPQVLQFPDVPAAASALGELVRPGDVVLIKASRGERLERVIEPLVNRNARPAAPALQ